jgi:hypothetical protein
VQHHTANLGMNDQTRTLVEELEGRRQAFAERAAKDPGRDWDRASAPPGH